MEQAGYDATLWRLTLQHSPIGMVLVDLDGRLTMVNRAACTMLGREADDLRSCTFQEITHPDDLDADLAQFERTLAGEIDSYRILKRYLRPDGSVVWGDLSVALVRDDTGEPQHFISQILDVSEEHERPDHLERTVAELETERSTLEAIFDTVNVGLLLIDADGRYERSNRRHQETMRLPFPDGHDGHAGQLGHVYRPDGVTLLTREEMPSWRATRGEEFDDYLYWVGHDPVTRSAFSTSARQVRGADGERRGATIAYQEVTDLMRALAVKDEFVASVSHELRTPLTAVLGHLEILAESVDLPPPVRRQLGVVRRNAERLRTLVSDLLEVAQAHAGSLQLDRDTVDVARLVHEALEAAAPAADAAGVALEVDVPEVLEALVDGQRLRQVVDNLVSNAVKYTDRGGAAGVRVGVDGTTLDIRVHDSGIGMNAAEVERAFTRFFRGSGALERHRPGTGLGLTIVQSIVEAHGGSISLSSEPGTGTEFHVRLPGAVLG